MPGAGLVAVSRLPRHTDSATMYFPKAGRVRRAARLRRPDLLRVWVRTFSTAECASRKDSKLRSVGLYFLTAALPHIDGQVAIPDFGAPLDAEPSRQSRHRRDLLHAWNVD